MAIDRMPITPAVLTWARERAGYSYADLRYSAPSIKAWEKGEESPTYLELEKLADRFEVPIAVFFFPDPPDNHGKRPEFQILGRDAFDDFPPRMQLLIERARYKQRDYASLCAHSRKSKRLITHDLRFNEDIDADQAAHRLREYLGIATAEQFRWGKQNRAFEEWRRALFGVGVHVVFEDFRLDGYSSFALYDPRFPIVCVNSSESFWDGGLLTVCHSLTRLLFSTSGVNWLKGGNRIAFGEDSRRIDELCDKISAETVVPRDALVSEFGRLRQSGALADYCVKLASRFGVGREWMNDWLTQLNLISPKQRGAILEEWAKEALGGGGGWDPVSHTFEAFGEAYIEMAFDSFDHDYIDEETLTDFLQTTPRNLEDLRRRLHSSET